MTNHLNGRLDETMSTYKKKKYAGLTTRVLQDVIHESLSRLASREWAKYMAACEELRLFNTKGRDYDNMMGQKVVVTYNEQDAEGYEVQVDYEGIVTELGAFWMGVQFELVPGSGVFDGDVCDVRAELQEQLAHLIRHGRESFKWKVASHDGGAERDVRLLQLLDSPARAVSVIVLQRQRRHGSG